MSRASACAGLSVALFLTAVDASAGPLEDLVGYWTGTGTVTMQAGPKEQVKCAVIYKLGGGGSELKQTMRCASAD